MRILLVSPYFPPQHAVASLRTHSFARCWAIARAEVAVLTTAKRDDQRGLDLPCEGFDIEEIPFRGSWLVEKLRAQHRPSSTPDAGGSAGGRTGRLKKWRDARGVYCSVRMPDLTDRWVKPAIAWAHAHGPWDVVVSSSGPYTAHQVARAIKQRWPECAWVAEFRDLWVDHPLYKGVFPCTLRERALQKHFLHEADLIITVSEGQAQAFGRQTDSPVEVIYNGCNTEQFGALDPQPCWPTELNKVRLVYTGMLYPPHQNPAPLLNALAQIKQRDAARAQRVSLEIAGRAGEAWRMMADAEGVGDMVTLHGEVPHEESLRMQRDGDALIVLDWDDPSLGVLTAKMMEYLHARAPILALGPHTDSPIGACLKETGRGVHLGEDVGAIAAQIEAMLDDASSIAMERNEALINTFTRKHQAGRLLEMMRGLGA